MQRSRFWLLTSLILVLALLLAACGGAATPTAQPTAETGAEPTAETGAEPTAETGAEPTAEGGEATGDEVVITVAAGAVGQELELTKAAAERYMEMHPEVTVNVLETIDSATDRLGLYLQFFEAQSGEVDVYQIDVIWPGDLAEHLIDLTPYADQAVIDSHFPAIIENNTVDGELKAIPWFTDAGLLYYRTDLLEKYGFDGPPETWAELEEMATAIQEGEQAENPDFVGYVWQGNAYEGLTCDALEWVASNGGGSIVSPDKVITINNENAVAAIEQAAAWVGTISPTGVTGFQEEDARKVWQAGNAAFMRNWPYAYSLSQTGSDEEPSAVADKFGVAPLPMGENGEAGAACLGGWQLAVSKYSEHPEVAADVALFLASEEEQKYRAIEGSLNPTIQSLYEDEEVLAASPFFGDLYGVFTNATPRPSTATSPSYNEVSTRFYTAVHSVLTGEAEAADALEELELELEELLGYETGEP